MKYNNFLQILSLLVFSLLFVSCGDDPDVEVIVDPCDGLELFEETATVNGISYQVSDPDYSDLLTNIWQFAFDATAADCSENYAFSFEFADRAPNYSGSYTTSLVSSSSLLDPAQKEALIIYRLDDGTNTKILSGGTATVNDNNDGTQTLTLDGIDENQNPVKAEVSFKFK